ncbi:SNIP1 [Cordylochernes scorpioides]|uniref:SNIP1 n=1 Tax=Cordylochernes scorpioides TaxID=51811 RepID=A0ABY6KEJ6_9ARAC|nr:SNIP1 [Cordylochernes scorpioides]
MLLILRRDGSSESPPPTRKRPRKSESPPPRERKHRSPETSLPRAYRHRSRSKENLPSKESKSKRRENGEHKRQRVDEGRRQQRGEDEDPRRREKPRRPEENDRRGGRRRDEEERRRHNTNRERNPTKFEWGGRAIKEETKEEEEPAQPKEKPNLETSGKLAEDTNVYKGVVIKYSEPEDARKPKRRWRLYRFKGEDEMPMIQLHRQSAYLFGRQRLVADIPIDHPSCSKQHAVLQFRLVPYERPDGSKSRRIRPYLIDLGSSNGTYINNKRIDSSRYVELMEMDVIKFGYSSREYVILHEDVEKNEVNPMADEDYQDEEKEVVEEPAKKSKRQEETTEET